MTVSTDFVIAWLFWVNYFILFSSKDLFIIEGKVYYTIHSGTTLDAIPFSSTFELTADGQKIQNYRAYVDASPLFAALAPK